MGRVEIDLGCGWKKHPGSIGFDRKRYPSVDIVCDLSKSIPLRNGSVDKVYTSHFLEHLHSHEIGNLLKEIVRVCKPKASVLIQVPYWSYEAGMFPGHRHTMPPRFFEDLEVWRRTFFGIGDSLKVVKTTYRYVLGAKEFCHRLGITLEEGRKFLNNIVYDMTVELEVIKTNILIAFDVDGVLRISGGPIPSEWVIRLWERGAIVGFSGNWVKAKESGLDGLDFYEPSGVEALKRIKEKFKADIYIHVGDLEEDRKCAEQAGFTFIWANQFKL